MILMSNNQWLCDANLWHDTGDDCSAEARVGGLLRAYKEIMPDVLGLQESSERMAELMMAELKCVDLGDGKTAKYSYISGGNTPIIYRSDKYRLLESGFFLYPEHIDDIEGSFNNIESKSYCFGVFEDRNTGKRFALMTTHLWWKSSNPSSGRYQARSNEARAYQIGLASERMDRVIAKYRCPCVLMGDLNASVNSLCLERARNEGWTEVYDLCVGDRDETCGFHPCEAHGYSRGESGSFCRAIDHILIKNGEGTTVNFFRRLTHEWFDRLSDHYPLYIDLSL